MREREKEVNLIKEMVRAAMEWKNTPSEEFFHTRSHISQNQLSYAHTGYRSCLYFKEGYFAII